MTVDQPEEQAPEMTWGAVFNRFKLRGLDASDAAYRADQWEKRQHQDRWAHCPSTHCERRQECASPNDCSARTVGGFTRENTR